MKLSYVIGLAIAALVVVMLLSRFLGCGEKTVTGSENQDSVLASQVRVAEIRARREADSVASIREDSIKRFWKKEADASEAKLHRVISSVITVESRLRDALADTSDKGKIDKLVGVVNDLTKERSDIIKSAEEALRKRNEQIASLERQHGLDSLVIVSQAKEIVELNDQIRLQKADLDQYRPKWYTNNFLWFGVGVVAGVVAVAK